MHFSTSTIGALAVFAAGAHCIDLSNLPGFEPVPVPAVNKYLADDIAEGLLSARSEEAVYNSYEPTHIPEEDLPLEARSEHDSHHAKYADHPGYRGYVARSLADVDATEGPTSGEEGPYDLEYEHISARSEPEGIPTDYDAEATFSASDILARNVVDTDIPAGYDDEATFSADDSDDSDIQARDVDSDIPADYDDEATFSADDSDIQARDIDSGIPADYDNEATFSADDSDIQARDVETEVPADYDDEVAFHQFMARGIPVDEAHQYAHPDTSFEEYESDPHYLQARATEDEDSFLGEQVAEDDDEATFHQFMARGIPVDEAHEYAHPDTSFDEYESERHHIQARDAFSATHHTHIHTHSTGVSATDPTVPPTSRPTHQKHTMHARAASSLSQPHRATKTGQWAGVFGNLFGGDKGKHNRQHPRSVNMPKGE